ncbi:DUF1036 domain-containing protein [Paractinoplanes rishiriensis]|uniref:Uncharacterized protein n=1 Tax=Paractinoplanes rishiriensis TaxID=1050105 RepID=A0A919K7D6_9ACTN|nr:DUF1036 domain-containing protein [Actinoplanes rishiriensis]GIF02331.1 hypothetical protein Ari01nite_97950 [Actinoplanes rishiriensis]
MGKIGVLLATGAAVSGAVVGFAGPAAASDYNRTVNICNYSNERVQVAKISDQAGGMVSEGWYSYENGECSTLTGRFMRIKSADGSTWTFSGTYTTQFCVASKAFTIYSPNSESACDTYGGTMATFSSVPAGSGTHKINLRP